MSKQSAVIFMRFGTFRSLGTAKPFLLRTGHYYNSHSLLKITLIHIFKIELIPGKKMLQDHRID